MNTSVFSFKLQPKFELCHTHNSYLNWQPVGLENYLPSIHPSFSIPVSCCFLLFICLVFLSAQQDFKYECVLIPVPAVFFPIVPSAPILQLEPLNCTSIVARWQISPESVAVLGYRLCYHEEGQPEQPKIQLQAQNYTYTISGLGEWCHSCLAMRRWDSGADKKHT